jgi:hypothetical protein
MTSCIMSQSGPESSGYTKPEWWGLQEEFPELHVLVSALTAGPIAPGDGIGDINAALVQRTCRADGVLLKPDHPAHAIDRQWLQYVFARGGPEGEITQTSVTLPITTSSTSVTLPITTSSSASWFYALGANLKHDFNVSLKDDLGVKSSAGVKSYVAWQRKYGAPFAAPSADELRVVDSGGGTLLMPKVNTDSSAGEWGKYTLWKIAPMISCTASAVHADGTGAGTGWALLGEVGKFISVSPQRITTVSVTCPSPVMDALGMGMVVDVEGMPGEVIQMAFYSEAAQHVTLLTKTVDASGKAAFSVGS